MTYVTCEADTLKMFITAGCKDCFLTLYNEKYYDKFVFDCDSIYVSLRETDNNFEPSDEDDENLFTVSLYLLRIVRLRTCS
jgi:hypothetical protein